MPFKRLIEPNNEPRVLTCTKCFKEQVLSAEKIHTQCGIDVSHKGRMEAQPCWNRGYEGVLRGSSQAQKRDGAIKSGSMS
jgi:hypothetical protein